MEKPPTSEPTKLEDSYTIYVDGILYVYVDGIWKEIPEFDEKEISYNSPKCSHKFIWHVGLSEKFEYCEFCGEKK